MEQLSGLVISAMADLLTTSEVQDLLHVDRTTIYRMVDGGRLPAIRVGKQWRFSRSEIERWLLSQVVAPGTPTQSGGAPATDVQPAAGGALRDVFPIACAQPIQDAFAELLGVMIVVTDMAGQPVTRVSNPCGLYAAVIQDEAALAGCVAHWQQMAGAIPLEPRFAPSELGLLCARGLIRVGNELRGMVFFGGIAPDEWPPTEAQTAAIAAHFGLAPALVAAHAQGVYRMDRAARDRVLSYAQRIADIFSQMLEDRNVLYGRLQAIASLTAL
jgi:excisionase family DNA binding protein